MIKLIISDRHVSNRTQTTGKCCVGHPGDNMLTAGMLDSDGILTCATNINIYRVWFNTNMLNMLTVSRSLNYNVPS